MQKLYFGRLHKWIHTGSSCVSSEYYCETTKSLKIHSHLVDYIVWSVLCKRVYRTKISNVNELKPRINAENGSRWLCVTRSMNVPSAGGVTVYHTCFVGHRLSLRSQANPRPNDRTQFSLPFNGLHLVNHVITWITTQLCSSVGGCCGGYDDARNMPG